MLVMAPKKLKLGLSLIYISNKLSKNYEINMTLTSSDDICKRLLIEMKY